MLKVVIVGYGEMFTNLIAGALDANCKIVGVLRKETVKYNPIIKKIKDVVNPSREYNYIKSYNIPEIISPNGVNSEEFKKAILKLNPDLILVGSWFEKFSKEAYSLPKVATINAHPSLLPKYRGPNPYYWVIRNQEKKSGITFHLMDENFDTGAILAQEEIEILENDTGSTLKERTVLKARGVVCDLLMALQEDIIIPLAQREDRATYYTHPELLEIDFKKTSAEISAIIRASYNWAKTYFYHDITPLVPNGTMLSVEKNTTNYSEPGTVVDVDYKTKTLAVLCGDNKVLRMGGINHFKTFDKPFTKNYIKLEVKMGDVLI